jgi:hypothetical protein
MKIVPVGGGGPSSENSSLEVPLATCPFSVYSFTLPFAADSRLATHNVYQTLPVQHSKVPTPCDRIMCAVSIAYSYQYPLVQRSIELYCQKAPSRINASQPLDTSARAVTD